MSRLITLAHALRWIASREDDRVHVLRLALLIIVLPAPQLPPSVRPWSDCPPRSCVRFPSANACSTALRIAAAACSSPSQLKHHGGAEDRARRVGDPFPGDVRRRAVDGLEERRTTPLGIEIGRRVQPQAAGDPARQVAEDVAEEIRADDHVERVRAPDQVQCRGVDVQFLDG